VTRIRKVDSRGLRAELLRDALIGAAVFAVIFVAALVL